MGKILGILSLKGGVGKTSSAISLGSCLSDFGKKILVVDCNYSAPNLGVYLNLIEPKKTIHHVLSNSANIEDSIHSLEYFDIIPASIFKEPLINPLKLRDHLKFVKDKYDFIILDSSPSLNEETLSVILASDNLLIVTTPDYPTLSNTLKAVKVARERGTPIIGLILNKVYNKNFEISLDHIERTLDIPVMAVIPHDKNFSKSANEFLPYNLNSPNSRGSQEFKKLAAVLIGEKCSPSLFFSFFKKLTPDRQEINREIFYDSVFKS
jgi:septum site-determining protein MinD